MATKKHSRRRKIADLHPPTGLPYPQVQTFLRADLRYCIYYKSRGKTYIPFISKGDDDEDLRQTEFRKHHLKNLPLPTGMKQLPEFKTGLVQLRLLSPARIQKFAKFQSWITDPNPKF